MRVIGVNGEGVDVKVIHVEGDNVKCEGGWG